MKRHFPALRGIAIVLVIMNHAVFFAANPDGGNGLIALNNPTNYLLLALSGLGFVAVPTFLFLSGSFYAYAAKGDPPSISFRLILNNLQHVLVPYIFWSIIFYLFVFLAHGVEFSISGYIKNLLVGYPYNFVPLIIFFFILSPVLLFLNNRLGWLPLLLLIGLYQLLLILIVFPRTLAVSLPEWTVWFAPPVLATTLADWAIYFPLGLIYSLESKRITPWLQKFSWLIALIALAAYVLTLLHGTQLIFLPIARHIFPLALILLLPLLDRKQIPAARQMENVGRYAYGLYLTHLPIIDLTALLFVTYLPQLAGIPILTAPILLALGLTVPLFFMEQLRTTRARTVYRYLFG